jgi:hypothetical protein
LLLLVYSHRRAAQRKVKLLSLPEVSTLTPCGRKPADRPLLAKLPPFRFAFFDLNCRI